MNKLELQRMVRILAFVSGVMVVLEICRLTGAGFPCLEAVHCLRLIMASAFLYGLSAVFILIHIMLSLVVYWIFRKIFTGFRTDSTKNNVHPVVWIIASVILTTSAVLTAEFINGRYLTDYTPSDFRSIGLITGTLVYWSLFLKPVVNVISIAAERVKAVFSGNGKKSRSIEAKKRKYVFQIGFVLLLILSWGEFIWGKVHPLDIPWRDGISQSGNKVNEANIQGEAKDSSQWTIILISVETLRADHLNCLGYDRAETTPELNSIARQGYLFSQCRSQASWTKPAIASLMTSLLPTHHCQTSYGRQLPESIITIADILGHSGFTTATFPTIPGAHDPGFGFNEDFYGGFGPPSDKWPSLFQFNLFTGGGFLSDMIENKLRIYFPSALMWWYNDAEKVSEKVLNWLKDTERPLFCHIHFIDPHMPYLLHPYPKVQYNFRSRRNLNGIIEKYDGEIRFVDQQIGRISDYLESNPGPSLLVVVGDHGEEFMDRGGWGHGQSLYDELIRVPLIIRLYNVNTAGFIPVGAVIDDPVGVVDVAPTILDIQGEKTAPEEWDGVSLKHFLESDPLMRPVSYPVSYLDNNGEKAHSIIYDYLKVIRCESPAGGGEELGSKQLMVFDLRRDPLEENDLYSEANGESINDSLERKVARALTVMDSLVERTGRKSSGFINSGSMSQRERETLRTLGYLQ